MQNSSVTLLQASEQNDLQTRLQALAREAVSAVMEADPAHGKELLGLFVADLFSQVAEQERKEEQRKRQAEGIAAAKARGVHFGKKTKPLPENFDEVRRAWRRKEMTLQQAADTCGMPKATFYNAVERAERAETNSETSEAGVAENGKKNARRGRKTDSVYHPESASLSHPGAGRTI